MVTEVLQTKARRHRTVQLLRVRCGPVADPESRGSARAEKVKLAPKADRVAASVEEAARSIRRWEAQSRDHGSSGRRAVGGPQLRALRACVGEEEEAIPRLPEEARIRAVRASEDVEEESRASWRPVGHPELLPSRSVLSHEEESIAPLGELRNATDLRTRSRQP